MSRAWEVRSPIPIVQQWIDVLRPEVDMIVVLTHQNRSAPMQSDKEVDPSVQRGFDEDYAMAGALRGGRCHPGRTFRQWPLAARQHPETGTLIGLTFGQGKYLGYMKLEVIPPPKRFTSRRGEIDSR